MRSQFADFAAKIQKNCGLTVGMAYHRQSFNATSLGFPEVPSHSFGRSRIFLHFPSRSCGRLGLLVWHEKSRAPNGVEVRLLKCCSFGLCTISCMAGYFISMSLSLGVTGVSVFLGRVMFRTPCSMPAVISSFLMSSGRRRACSKWE